MATYYLTREIFNQNIHEICLKSNLIGDSWNLLSVPPKNTLKEEPILYLEKSEQECVKIEDSIDEIYTFTYHIIFSDSFAVPVLYLNVSKSSGCLLTHDELYSYYNLLKPSDSQIERDPVYDLVITQQEHPILFKPFYFVHPCKTADWMSLIARANSQEEDVQEKLRNCENYTLTWMSFVFSSFNIKLDTKYGLKLNVLKDFVENKV